MDEAATPTLKTKPAFYVEGFALSDFISAVYGRPYNILNVGDDYGEGYANDSCFAMHVPREPMLPFDQEDLDKLDSWLAREVTPRPHVGPIYEHAERMRAKEWDTQWAAATPKLWVLLRDLCQRQLIAPGTYVIAISW